jgi:hypothetical protein
MGTDNKNRWTIRDGTSQAERLPAELDPDYAQVDERTTRDLLAFAKEYARELKYFSIEDTNYAGDWSNFIGSDIDLDDVVNYVNDPETFPPEKAASFSRPHFALFLTFLELLDHSRSQLNSLTQRHLEFFYHDVLNMVRKQAIPDRVHVLVDLDSGTEQLALPGATALLAGKDSLGQDLVYRTEHELIANKVEVAQLSSLHAQIKITGIKQACPPNLVGGNRKEAFVAMLRIALGQPDPGDPLPLPVYPGVPSADQTEPKVNFEVVVQAQKLLAVVDSELYMSESGMPLFDDLRLLMRLKRQREENDEEDWKQINLILDKAGKTRTGKADFTINSQEPRDFAENLRAVLDLSAEDFATLFNRLTQVENVEDAYAVYLKRPKVREFIQPPTESAEVPIKSLYLSLKEFNAMMQIKVAMDNQWEVINQLLETAGKRKDADFKFQPDVRASQDFDSKFAAALATPNYTVDGGLDGYFVAFRAVEQYFYMSAENYNYIMSVATREDVSAVDEGAWDNVYKWDKVYEIVATAHREMIYTRRRNALKAIAQPDPNIAITDKVKALGDVLAVVVGKKLQLEVALKELVSYGVADKDQVYLNGITNNENAIDWDRVYKVLEVAQRNRENLADPVAEYFEWLNLYPAADARKVLAQSTKPDDETLPRWKTFGEGKQVHAKESVPPAALGWAMASPLLALSEGKRTIILLLGFSADAEKFDVDKLRSLFAQQDDSEFVANFNPFQVQLSTAKGWLEPESVKISWADPEMTYPEVKDVDTTKLRALVLQITLAQSQPALEPLTRDVHGVDTAVPVLRLMLKPVWDEQMSCYVTTSYTVLRNMLLMRARLTVSVDGLASLNISNDQSTLDAKKPFEPFGSEPDVGSRFYLGHDEIVSKKLDSLSFNISWMGVPSNLASADGHYKNYPAKLENKSFTAKVSLVEGNVLKDFPDALTLFNATDATKPVGIALTPPEDQGNPEQVTVAADDVTKWHRYLQWELTPNDFQHSVYPTVALQKSLEMAAAVANKTADGGAVGGAEKYQVKPPYTPKIKSLSLDYSASAELLLDSATEGIAAMYAYHIGPFGFAELKPESVQAGCLFLPRYDFEGELYIGLRNVTAPQNLSLLFQVAEGSADPDLKPEPVQWSYLSGNHWLSLQDDGSLLADGTRGLINSGIVELALKQVQPNTLLPEDLYWIRAAITRSSKSVCDMVEIHPNAVLATFADDNNAADHLSAPLPAESIKAPVEPIPGVTRLLQPYTSFDGKMAEQDSNFYVRVSERLRHKRRALTPWDYERLVLEKFPQIYKAKCLPADPITHSHDPGKIELVVIPDIRNRLPFNPFEPKAPANQIRDIQTFLQDKTPPFVRVEVKNAHYLPVMVRCGVRFLPGQDVGFCRRRLNEELNRFLAPWAYEEGADLVIGGSVYANSIINFIDRRDYVDYLAGFKMFLGEGQVAIAETEGGYHASADRPGGVLVAARKHIFDVISDADYRVEEFTGINYMKIELDFTVA